MRALPILLLGLGLACGGDDDAEPTDAGSSETDAAGDIDAGGGMRDGGDPPLVDAGGGVVPTGVEGYGFMTAGGAGGEECRVVNLDDDGPGSLRDCIENRNGSGETVTPRTVVFDVGGVITLQSDISIRVPFLTVDGQTAPSPGITIRKVNTLDGEVKINGNTRGAAHDIIVRYLRFDGDWDYREDHPQNSATIALDGEDTPGGIYNIVLSHLTLVRGSDSSPDMWGDVHDVSLQWSIMADSLHPTTISHSGGVQQRARISLHHNVYTKNHERNPQVRGNVVNLDLVNNVIFDWTRFGGGYGIRLRERDGVVPTDVNVVGNYFASMTNPQTALLFEPTSYPGDVYASDNLFPPEYTITPSTVGAPIPVPAGAAVTTYPAADLDTEMLPYVGTHFRNAEEQAWIDEIAAGLRGR